MNYAAGLEAAKSFEWLEAVNASESLQPMTGLRWAYSRVWPRAVHVDTPHSFWPVLTDSRSRRILHLGSLRLRFRWKRFLSDVYEELARLAKNPAAPGRTLKYGFLPPKWILNERQLTQRR